MVVLLGLSFVPDLSLFSALQVVPGIGRNYAFYICKNFGISLTTTLSSLSRDLLKDVHRFVTQNRSTGPILFRVALNNIRFKIQLKTYQGYRHLEGLPVRGQNTKSNAQTSRLLKKKSNFNLVN